MIRAGVVGVGHLGREHARIYASLPDVELAGVVEVDVEKGREIAKLHDTTHFTRAEELIPKVDAVSIVVPTPLHCEASRPFLEAGKAVLIEKPLATSLSEADEIIHVAADHGATLQVGHIERFNPVLTAALPHIREPVFIECDRIHPFSLRSTDVSVVLDLMIHDIDLVLHISDDEVEELDAFGASVLSPTEDLASARILFRHGCTAMVKTSRVAMQRSRKIRIFCERSYISLDLVERRGMRIYLDEGYDPQSFLDENGRISAPEGEAAFLAQHLRTAPLEIPSVEPLAAELQSFLQVAGAGGTPLVTGLQGRRAMETALRIEERMKYHRDRLRRSRGR